MTSKKTGQHSVRVLILTGLVLCPWFLRTTIQSCGLAPQPNHETYVFLMPSSIDASIILRVEAEGRAFWVACLSDGTVVGATGLRMERPERESGQDSSAAEGSKGPPSGFRDLEEGHSELMRMTVSAK